ncbi:hypothetical protein D9611_013149 [Ephemerocybe angulata]|uniref:ATP-dependent DNA helicase n=1 Tax=Ephemerocybe angulata TaxID=980116 RepID=A0A8H5BXH0_9AGAR|nr:hypothetical protein D9611_013149 [Tulosesus angulatus]
MEVMGRPAVERGRGDSEPGRSADDVSSAWYGKRLNVVVFALSSSNASSATRMRRGALDFVDSLRAYKLSDVKEVLRSACGAKASQVKTWAAVTLFAQTIPQQIQSEVMNCLMSAGGRPRGVYQPPPPEVNAPLPDVQMGEGAEGGSDGMDVDPPLPAMPDTAPVDLGVSPDFMKCVDRETIDACIEEYTLRTSNDALKEAVCISCERRLFMQDLVECNLEDVPNRRLLAPVKPHPAHVLTDGMLLATGEHGLADKVHVCPECFARLKAGKRPRLSLANGLWVGRVPPELENLTLPERLLISLYFPVAYVVKLYPSGRRSLNWNQDRLNSGLKGNVSTYKLDQQQISDMVGLTMPPPPSLLSSTIAISYIGINNLPKWTLPGTFRVRRHRVARALQWLKANNPLYSNIEISETRLEELPVNAVPQVLLDTTRHATETGVLDTEHASYVPLHEDEDEDDFLQRLEDEDDMVVDEEVPVEQEEGVAGEVLPAVIPLQALGVIDTAGHDIPDNELFAHALLNTAHGALQAGAGQGSQSSNDVPQSTGTARPAQTPQAEAPPVRPFATRLRGATTTAAEYGIRHGSAFVNEYPRKDPVTGLRYDGGPDDPNHLLGTFPFLFPYGKGGFETDQKDSVTYESHVRWALQYADRRFRKDLLFVFHTFGVLQKRQVCRAAVLQINSASDHVLEQLKTITPEDMIVAAEEELKGKPFSNPAVRILRSQLSAIRSRVMGTDESRHSLRGKIWGTNLLCNNASLWVTINLPDTHDPIVQVLAGEDIDLNAFCKTLGPDAAARAVNVAGDPFAAAQYFHRTINLVLETLFGIKGADGARKIHRKEGILGTLRAYIGSVEAQGRGTLHVHMLLWMVDTPDPQRCKELLESEWFRERLRAFVAQNIVADVEGRTTKEMLPLPVDKNAAYTRPLDPRDSNIVALRKERTRVIARTLQFHHCKDRVCRVVKSGRVVCKRGAPWTLAAEAWVSEAGRWGPMHVCAFLNAWNPTLLEVLCCNHDLKLMIAGGATRSITWYITNYASKKQQRSNNQSALLAKSFAYHTANELRNPDAVNSNKRLLQRCANSLARDREFSAPEIISYLMGWGDRFESHHYVAIRWDIAFKSLLQAYPALGPMNSRSKDLEREPGIVLGDQEEREAFTLQYVDGTLDFRSQVKEYAFRGEGLEGDCFLRVMLDTYDAPLPASDSRRGDAVDFVEYLPGEGCSGARGGPRPGRTGRARHVRYPYLEGFAARARCRVRRSEWHETMPRIVGRWFPRNDDPQTHELYCASMLMLLKPWRTLRDLKSPTGTFKDAFDDMMQSADDWKRTVVRNIQFYYDCADDAQAEATEARNSMSYRAPLEEDLREQSGIAFGGEFDPLAGLKEEDVELAAQGAMSQRDMQYVEQGLLVAHGVGIPDVPHDLAVVQEGLAVLATEEDFDTIKGWEKNLKAYTREHGGLHASKDGLENDAGVVDPSDVAVSDVAANVIVIPPRDGPGEVSANVEQLNAAQRRAHDMIVECVVNEVEVHGQGGTGKTTLIQAVTQTLERLNMKQYLGKTATSGIAASPIRGNTVHHYWGIAPMRREGDPEWVSKAAKSVQERRRRNIAEKHIIFTDEMSMLTKVMLADMSEVGGVVRAEASMTKANSTLPFGGLHMVLFGDFHQFPPVAGGRGGQGKENSSALYCHQPLLDKQRMALGREIFLQFENIVILTEQNRSRDPGWTELLNRLRVGECTDDDLNEVQKLVLTDPRCEVPNFNEGEWRDVVLVTPRHRVRKAWNDIAIAKHCRMGGHLRYVILADDVDKLTDETPRLDFRIAAAAMAVKQTGGLDRTVVLGKGMKAMVLTNVATEADVANGTRGVIESIWLHPEEEPTVLEDGVVVLRHMPPVIFFQPNEKTAARFPGVKAGLIPISPVTASFQVTNGMGQKITVKRTQYALTGAYAFTDYKSQGQTIEKVIIDIGKPPQGALSPFNAYVALLRGRGRDSIRLLRDFDGDLFTTHPSENLRAEMSRLQALAARTERERAQELQRRTAGNGSISFS